MLDTLLTMIVGALFVGLGVFLRGYLMAKGTNVATREDIRGITTAVEDIRIEYSRKLETLRDELQALRDIQTRVRDARHEAQFAFVEPCLELLLHRLPLNLGDLPFDQGKSLYAHQEALATLCTRIQVAYFRLQILVPPGDPLILSAVKIYQATPELAKAVRMTFGRIKRAALDEERCFREGRHKGDADLEAAVAAVDIPVRAFLDAVREPADQIGKAFDTFCEILQRQLLETEMSTRR